MRTQSNTNIVTVFVSIYVITTGLWLLPHSDGRDALLTPIMPVIEYLGLWQSYRIFAPPETSNFHLSALIWFKDGSTINWSYPQMARLGLLERMKRERFRKFVDHVNDDSSAIFRPDFARYVAHINNKGGHEPAIVVLERHWADIPPPPKGFEGPLPAQSNHRAFFSYQLQKGDL